MKKFYYLTIVLYFIFSQIGYSQQILGGDITWECIPSGANQGKYMFQLTLFNRCDSGSLASTQTINVHNAPISSFSVSLSSEKSISPTCYDSTQSISCSKVNSGAITKGVYLSSPVSLSGIPPTSGYVFTWVQCCRNSNSSNIQSAAGYTLRSVMYPFNNTNTSTCYDNSPHFLGAPIMESCVGYPMTFTVKGYDPDYDQVDYSFALPLTNSSTWPASGVLWNPGYSVSSPFPGTYHNSGNSPASIRSHSSEISFNSISLVDDNIYYTVKATSKRDNIVIAEVFRDGFMQLKTCPPTPTFPPIANTPPSVVFKDYAGATTTLPLPLTVDYVLPGDTLEKYYTSSDVQFLPGFVGQTNYLEATSTQFPTYFNNPTVGCDKPPCATMDTNTYYKPLKNNFSGQYGTAAYFRWAIDSNHGSQDGMMYHFHFKTMDNWCPQPGLSEYTHSVVVHSTPDNSIQGTVYDDINGNGIQDTGENGHKNVMLKQSPNSFYTNTDLSGSYSLGAYQGTFDVDIILPKYHTVTAPASGKHTVVSSGTNNVYSGKDFGIQLIPNINDLFVDILHSGWTRPGWSSYYWLTYKNLGTSVLSGSIKFEYDTLLDFDTASVLPITSGANTLTWNFSNLPAFSSQSVFLQFTVDSAAIGNDSIQVFAEITPILGDTFPLDNKDSLLNIVVNSFDPNAKAVLPERDIYVQEVEDQNYLEYIVHFQNTGTASAINVKVRDDIETSLNIESIEMIASSHNNTYQINGRRIIWNFDNINLPDSGSDFLGSQGFVKFRIIPDTNLVLGDSIHNSVSIFFDFNSPIYADVITHIVEEVEIGITEQENISNSNEVEIFIYPNPTKESTHIKVNSNQKGSIELGLYSISGELIHKSTSQIRNGTMESDLNLGSVEKGIYFLRFSGDNFTQTKRIVKF